MIVIVALIKEMNAIYILNKITNYLNFDKKQKKYYNNIVGGKFMRKVYKGRFADKKPFQYDGFEHMIGQHKIANREAEWLLRTARLEYYIKGEDGINMMITDATKAEKLIADIKYIFKTQKYKVVGYRTDRISSHDSTECKKDKGRATWRVNNEDIKEAKVESNTIQTTNPIKSEERE